MAHYDKQSNMRYVLSSVNSIACADHIHKLWCFCWEFVSMNTVEKDLKKKQLEFTIMLYMCGVFLHATRLHH